MIARSLGISLWLAIFSIFAAGPLLAAPDPGTAEKSNTEKSNAEKGDADRGRSIYARGLTADGGTIEASFGDEGFTVEASVLPCASCHGHDGRGRPEGGISPSDLTWSSLTHPRGGRNEAGREHPPYDERSLLRAVTMGIDPAGNELSTTMPRYHLSHQDAADLVAYVRRLEEQRDPGISEDSLLLGTLLPADSPQAGAVLAALDAFFDELNERGGLYGRTVRFKVFTLPAPGVAGEALAASLREEWKDEAPFALIAPDISRREGALAKLFAAELLPVVGPFALQPQLEMPPNRYVFYLIGGVDSGARALLDFAAEQRAAGAPGRLLLLEPEGASADDKVAKAWLDSARDQAKLGSWSETLSPPLTEVFDRQFKPSADDTVLFLGGGEALSSFLRRADAQGWHPQVLVPGAFAGANIFSAPRAFQHRLYLAFPVLPSDAGHAQLEEVWAMAKKHQLSQRHLAAQLTALAAAQVFVEAASRAGQGLSRERLIESLESLYRHPTGLLPEVTYNANRRLGARGMHIVRANLDTGQFEPTGQRITPR